MGRRFLAVFAVLLIAATAIAPADGAAQGTPNVVISEVHYHPLAVGNAFPDFDDRENTEFIEIANLESSTVNVAGWCLDDGVDYCFPAGTALAPMTAFVIADDATAFDDLYNFNPNGVYAGKLSNNGEAVRLIDANGLVVAQLSWQTADPWPVTPDGNGPSLELAAAAGDRTSPANWAASSQTNGNPGALPSLSNAAPPLVTSYTAAELVSANQSIPVSVTAVNTSSMTLVYNIDYGANQTLTMTQNGATWQATLPALSSGGLIQYRFEASGPGGVTTSPRVDDIVSWWAVAVASSQPHNLPVLDLYFSPQNWDNIDNRTCPCTGAVAYEGQIWTDVAVRRAGFTSVNQPKAHLRLDFPAGHPFVASFLDGPVDEVTLDAGFPNYDLLREKLSWDVMAEIGFPPIRSENVRVHQVGGLQGLYLLREEQDGAWRSKHDLDRGAFYKFYTWNSSPGFTGGYEKKEALDEPETDLLALGSCVTQSGAALRACLLDTVDVPQMINEFAAVTAVWQTDQREFNFFIYRDNAQNMLWRMLPDDLDRTWGNHSGGGGLVNPVATSAKPYGRCVGTDGTPANEFCRAFMSIPEFKDMYLRRLRTLTDEVLADPQWRTETAAQAALIAPDWDDDDAKWNRTGYSFSAITSALDGYFADYVAHLRSGGHEGNIPAAQSTAPPVAITDYRSDPGDGLGYVKITNPSATESVDLSNWSFAGLAEIPIGLVVMPGATVAVSTDDQAFRAANPSFTGIRAQTDGVLAGPVSLIRRDGSVAATAGDATSSQLILNEWNAVSSSNTVAQGDETLGTIPGNGGDWFELVVIEAGLDIRGWRLVLSDASGASQAVTDELVFSQDPLLANLESGTIITVSEGFADDTVFVPAADDWHLNFQSNSADAGAFFTASSQSNFSTNHDNWQLTIFDDSGALVFGPVGEGIGATAGINSSEIGELEADPSATVSNISDYGDGDGSTFGRPNVNAGVAQDLSALRFPYLLGDVDCNGDVRVIDALRIAQYGAGLLQPINQCPLTDPLSQLYIGAGDTDSNGEVNVIDALLIARCTAGLPNVLCPDE